MISGKAYLFSWFAWLFLRRSYVSKDAFWKKIEATRRNPTDFRPQQSLRTRFDIQERQVGGHAVFDIAPKSKEPSEARILYMHGGGFVFEISPSAWNIAATLAERLRATVTVPIYPLGPEHTMQAIQDMLQLVYDDLAKQSAPSASSPLSQPFWAAGDSAGGHSALVLTQEALKAGKPIASRLVLISPPVDVSFVNPEVYEAAKRDPWFAMPAMLELQTIFKNGRELNEPTLSPIYGDVNQLPPILVFAGENDLLTPDVKLFVKKVQAAGRDITLMVGKDMVHVWPLLGFRESRDAVNQMVDWLEKAKLKS